MMNELNKIRYWSLDINKVMDILQSKDTGLSCDSVVERRKKYGKNIFTERKPRSPLALFFLQFLSPLIGILLFAAAITSYLNEMIETMVILSAVILNVILGFYQEYKAEHTIEMLQSYIKNKAKVLRDGDLQEIDAEDLVLGDIISVIYGSRIPADALLIQSDNLRVDESILTGESIPVQKICEVVQGDELSGRHNTVYCGTYVTEGAGLALVVGTGNFTEIGKIATSVSQTKRVLTPVQNAVKQISWYIFSVTILIVGLIFFLGVLRGEDLFEMLVLSAAVAVGAVPEALPIALTVILSIGILNISKKGGLIRKLSAAETLGSTTLIMTDKTGTLTKAELTLESVYSTDELLDGNVFKKTTINSLSDHHRDLFRSASHNITATVEKITDDLKNWVYTGGAFDIVVLKSMHRFGIERSTDSHRLVLPFNSTNKYSVSINSTNQIVLGAPDILINNSNLSDLKKEEALKIIRLLSFEGKRLIAIGQKNASKNYEDISELSLMGIFVFSDPIREDVPKAIRDIQSKGVKVVIITGDMLGTAQNVAERVGICPKPDEIISGDDLKGMDDESLKRILAKIKLFFRVTPEDKMRVGNLYREMGEVVAMTGDGVNDAPALKSMDIGISLGSGSDVAKSAADMILLDNNFKTVTDTITEGYKIRSNIQKTFVYLMSNSLDEVFVIAGSLIAGLALPLSALQIIWVNMLTGTLPALAFAYDNYHVSDRNHREGIFDFRTKFLALGIGTFSSLLLFVFYFILVNQVNDAVVARSIFFVSFSTYVLTISYSFRDLNRLIFTYNPFTNIRLNLANIIGFVLIIGTVTIPFLQNVFGLSSIPLQFLWIILVWNVINIILVESAKWGISAVSNMRKM